MTVTGEVNHTGHISIIKNLAIAAIHNVSENLGVRTFRQMRKLDNSVLFHKKRD